jgi:ubiquinone/menaquinone biosynthesis C-methylase UbiE
MTRLPRHSAARIASAWLAMVLLAVLCTSAAAAAQHARLFPPEFLGLLEGPDRDAFQRPDQIMDALQIGEGSVVADLGAGGGWFTVRLARRVGPNGRVYAEDIQPQMIDAIKRRVQREGLANVHTVLGTAVDPALKPGSVDAALLVDTYHEIEQPVTLLKNVARALKPAGVIGIVNYKKDGGGPGPDMEERVDPEKVIADAQAAGLQLRKRETFLRYQYMLTFGLPPK